MIINPRLVVPVRRHARLVVLVATVALALVADGCGDSDGAKKEEQHHPPLGPGEMLVEGDGITLFARVRGDAGALPIIVINGGPGVSSHLYVVFEGLAANGYRVVTYDQRGVGRSSKPDDGDYSLARHVDDLEVVRAALAAPQVVLLGHSWGGLVTMAYTTSYPERVAALELYGSMPATFTQWKRAEARFNDRVVELQAQGVIPEDLPLSCRAQIDALLPAYLYDPAFVVPPDTAGFAETTCAAVANLRSLGAIADYDLTTELAAVTAPVAVMMGEGDAFGLAMADDAAAPFTTAPRRAIFSQCGHFWFECAAAVLNEVSETLVAAGL